VIKVKESRERVSKMIEITINPKVLEALKQAFPKPANSANRALSKYIETLKSMLIEALSRGQSNYEIIFKLFSLSLQQLANKGGQIGSNRIRLHAWLRDNNLELVRAVEIGSNLTGSVSKVTLTDLVSLEWYEPEIADNEICIDGVVLNKTLLNENAELNTEIFKILFPDFDVALATCQEDRVFDVIDIDVVSLTNYIKWLKKSSIHIPDTKLSYQLFQARIILSVAQYTGGYYLQRKKPSQFGRNYYSGTSVQNVSKQLRQAMLGNCWEYDVRSCVITWKMGFANEIVMKFEPDSSVRRLFVNTLWYLEDKNQFMRHVQRAVFGKDSQHEEQFQLNLLKQAFTALSFGARKNGRSWKNENGKWVSSALVDILKITEERQRFINNLEVNGFINEQKIIDTYLFKGVKALAPDLLTLTCLQTKTGRASQAKVIAYLYQHEETKVMNIVRDALPETHTPPLANIHDAIILKRRLSLDDKHEIELEMRKKTGNSYWRLGATELKRWESSIDWKDVL
jgi:hypothetical protein